MTVCRLETCTYTRIQYIIRVSNSSVILHMDSSPNIARQNTQKIITPPPLLNCQNHCKHFFYFVMIARQFQTRGTKKTVSLSGPPRSLFTNAPFVWQITRITTLVFKRGNLRPKINPLPTHVHLYIYTSPQGAPYCYIVVNSNTYHACGHSLIACNITNGHRCSSEALI